MAMRPNAQQPESEVQLKIVGSNTFGRNPKMSSEQTFNMMISDGWLVQTPGYKKVLRISTTGRGRAIFSSTRGNFMIAVFDNNVYRISGPANNLTFQQIFQINTFFGDVFIDENSAYQIAICDKQNLWIYDWRANSVTEAVLPTNTQTGNTIVPGYVTYHDGYFIVPDLTSSFWYLSKSNDGTDWNWGAGGTAPVFGAIQTKPDNAVAVLRAPGKGNLIYVFGQNVTEMWYDNGAQLFPYQRSNSVSIDYGCASANTIAAMDEYVAFLGINEKAGPTILVSAGGPFERISNDGIDFKLADVAAPSTSYAFFYRIDGHVFYQITFYDPRDNFSLIYDFNTKAFFYVTNESMNYHIAESIAFYNNTYYFVSLIDSCVYELSSNYFVYDYTDPSFNSPSRIFEIPRMRVCNSMEQTDTSQFIANSLTFNVEMGVDESYPQRKQRYITTEGGKVISTEHKSGYVGKFLSTELVLQSYVPRIDMSISKDDGQTFGNTVPYFMNPLGVRKNRVIFWGLGSVNSLVVQFRFWSKSRVTVSDGIMTARERPD